MNKHKHCEVIKAWADGAEIEIRNDRDLKWSVIGAPQWDPHYEYRVKLTKPSIYWDHVDNKYNYITTDTNGRSYIYTGKPVQNDCHWQCGLQSDKYVETDGFASFDRGTCDWKDSLISRPLINL